MVCGSDVTVEYDKLIDRQLERAAITTISGFAKLFQAASRVLKISRLTAMLEQVYNTPGCWATRSRRRKLCWRPYAPRPSRS